MKNLALALALAVTSGISVRGASLSEAIQAGYAAVRALQPMHPGQSYSLPVGGTVETGIGDHLLRRRTAMEITESKLSCGCGDNALVFLRTVEHLGMETLFIDSAEISSASLLTTFSGHVVVALRPPPVDAAKTWCLVDTTNLNIIDEHWSSDARSFAAFGEVFWIGYCGSFEKYPVHSPDELKQFYGSTLAGIPSAVLSSFLVRLDFKIDPSLKNPDGALANPNLREFMKLQEKILKERGLNPASAATIVLQRGGENAQSDLSPVNARDWVAHIGTKSACSPSLLDYFENRIRRSLKSRS